MAICQACFMVHGWLNHVIGGTLDSRQALPDTTQSAIQGMVQFDIEQEQPKT